MNAALARDPVACVGPSAGKYAIEFVPGQDVSSQLSTLGLAKIDVPDVVLSHPHFGHAGGLGSFRHAQTDAQEDELDFARTPPEYKRTAYIAANFEYEHDRNLLSGDHDMSGDGSVICLRTPGHQSLLVRLRGSSIILVGDAACDREKMRRRRLPGFLWNPDRLLESWDRLQEMQRLHGAILLFAYGRAYKTTVRVAPGVWYE